MNYGGDMKLFEQVCQESKKFNEKRDCAIKAVAIVCDTDYKVVHKIFKKLGRKDRQYSAWWMIPNAINELGYTRVRYGIRSKTIRTVEKELPCGKRFLIETRAHALAVRHGEIQDWTKGTCCRIKHIYEIVKR